MNALITYLKNVRAELAHVVWPSQRQAIAHVAVIGFITLVTVIIIGVLDYLFTSGVGKFLIR